MIQRIQSIYFLLAGILPAFTFCVPSAGFFKNGYGYAMDAAGISNSLGETVSHPWGVMAFTVLCIVLPVITIFRFKERLAQIKMANGQIVSLLLLYITTGVYAYAFARHGNMSMYADWGLMFPTLSLLFTWLGRRAVCHDEALVRAADRIR